MASLHSTIAAASSGVREGNGLKIPITHSLTPRFVRFPTPKLDPAFGVKYSRAHGHGIIRIMAASAGSQMEASIKANISKNPLVIYSKSRCPYCRRVKDLFKRIGVEPLLVELDQLGPSQRQVQSALQRLTGQSTVPNIFIGGKHIGGCSDTMALHQKGELIPLLTAAGLKVS